MAVYMYSIIVIIIFNWTFQLTALTPNVHLQVPADCTSLLTPNVHLQVPADSSHMTVKGTINTSHQIPFLVCTYANIAFALPDWGSLPALPQTPSCI